MCVEKSGCERDDGWLAIRGILAIDGARYKSCLMARTTIDGFSSVRLDRAANYPVQWYSTFEIRLRVDFHVRVISIIRCTFRDTTRCNSARTIIYSKEGGTT